MAMLPSDLILDEILPRLPVKSLLRFKCVSKYFDSVISSPQFSNLQLRHSLSSDTERLLMINQGPKDGSGLHFFDVDTPEIPPVPLLLPDDFELNPTKSIVGSCNGLFLLRSVYYWGQYLLVNPSTRFYSFIPETDNKPIYNYICGLGYDAHTDDYKIFAISYNHIFMVYSVTNRLWHSVDIDTSIIRQRYEDAVIVDNHLCHWLVWCPSRRKRRIVCFDLCIETWTHDVPLPTYSDSGSKTNYQLNVDSIWVMDGSLCVLETTPHFNTMWVMREYGVGESWIKLPVVSNHFFRPLAYGRGTNSNAMTGRDASPTTQLIWWSHNNDEQLKKSEIHDVHGVGFVYDACLFKGSLVIVPNGKRIEY